MVEINPSHRYLHNLTQMLSGHKIPIILITKSNKLDLILSPKHHHRMSQNHKRIQYRNQSLHHNPINLQIQCQHHSHNRSHSNLRAQVKLN